MEIAVRMTALAFRPRLDGLGAEVEILNLTAPVGGGIACAIREVLADHGALWFRAQQFCHDALKRFSRAPRPFGSNLLVHALPQHPEILEVRRNPEERTAVSGGGWNSDWRYLPDVPAMMLHHAKFVPAIGDDTRAVLHCATGGYDGHLRLAHQTVVA